MLRIVAIYLLVLLCSCGSSKHSASFKEPKSGALVTIELQPAHPYLAEYNRILFVTNSRLKVTQYKLTMDTGGYAAANLYICPNGNMMLDSYSEFVAIHTATGKIRRGKCLGPPVYLGVFDRPSGSSWAFFSASQRPEVKLVMGGG